MSCGEISYGTQRLFILLVKIVRNDSCILHVEKNHKRSFKDGFPSEKLRSVSSHFLCNFSLDNIQWISCDLGVADSK